MSKRLRSSHGECAILQHEIYRDIDPVPRELQSMLRFEGTACAWYSADPTLTHRLSGYVMTSVRLERGQSPISEQTPSCRWSSRLLGFFENAMSDFSKSFTDKPAS